MYQLLIEKQVQKQLEKIPVPDYHRVKAAINALAKNPRPEGYKKLKGNYRVVYNINDHILTVFILAAGHRKEIYE